MASVKLRGGRFELTVKRKAIREKPWYFTFDLEADAVKYGQHLEALLDSGIVPPELVDVVKQYSTIGDVVRKYLVERHVAAGDAEDLGVMLTRIGGVKLQSVNYKWVESWLGEMKRVSNLAPSTIRHRIGALARCFDWAITQGVPELAPNPLRLLPKGYSTYTPSDRAFVQETAGMEVKFNTERDRRLNPGEEERIRSVMNRDKPDGRERAFSLRSQAAIECMFDLAVETAMRMRETYTVRVSAIDLAQRTIFLPKTKNGKVRQVPLSSVALASIERYVEHVRDGTRGMKGFSLKDDRLFPWWDGRLDVAYLRATTTSLSQQYARIFEAAGCPDLNYHDLRHEATSRFFERTQLSEFEIMKITGHSSIKMLSRYANLRGSSLAAKLW